MDNFIRQSLTISVAQICDNIGWHSITDSSMKMMTDILLHYITDLSVTSKKYAEHAYRDVPGVEDVELTFRQKSISLADLCQYLKSTGPVKFPHTLPLLNIPGKDVLNALKPGSREIVTRPIHIHEHLPTLNSEPVEEEQTVDTEQVQNTVECSKHEPEEVVIHKRLREISSVVMTSGGFLSPSREGRLAESKLLPFPEIQTSKPLESLKLTVTAPHKKDEPSQKSSTSKKKIKSKKILKSGIKKKQKDSEIQDLLFKLKEKKPEVLKQIKKPKEEKIKIPEEPVQEPEIDIMTVAENVQIPKQIIPPAVKTKIEEALPKFSFFGPLPQGPGLIPSTVTQINALEIIKKPSSPVRKVENEDISRKELKKKKKDKKKEKKEKKKQKEKEKKKEKIKCSNKVPKIKLRFGNRVETITEALPVEKAPDETIKIVITPEPMDVEVDIESKSDISVDPLLEISSPPKVPLQKIKTKKDVTKPIQPTIPPVDDTPPPAFYFDDAGNQVWICPMCTKRDDGSPMIGCDGCDVWYHWVCVGIQCPPDCAVWYCPRCLAIRAQQPKGKRGRPRKNKF